MLRSLLYLSVAVFLCTAKTIQQSRHLRSEIEIDWQRIGDAALNFISWIVQRFHRNPTSDDDFNVRVQSDDGLPGFAPVDSEESTPDSDFDARLKQIEEAKAEEIKALRAKRTEKLATIKPSQLGAFWERQTALSKEVNELYGSLREQINFERVEYHKQLEREALKKQWMEAKQRGEKLSQEVDVIWDEMVETKLMNIGVLDERNDPALDELQKARKARLETWWKEGGRNNAELEKIWTEEIEKSKTLLQQHQHVDWN